MTLTLVTLTLPDTDSVFTEFNGHCHSSSILLPPAPSLPFGRGLGAQPPMPVCDNLHCPLTPSPRSSTRAATLAQRLSDPSRSLRRPQPVRYDARIATPQPANSRPG